MQTTIKGIYKDGRIVLDEDPGVSGESPVMVTFYAIDDDIAKKNDDQWNARGFRPPDVDFGGFSDSRTR